MAGLRVDLRVLGKNVLLLLAAMVLSACGYHFPGGDEGRFPHLQTVYVDSFVNKTGEIYAENIISSALRRRFAEEGRFKLAASRDKADLVCRGSIQSIHTAPLSYRASTIAAEERMTVVMEVILEESANGRVVWADRALTATGDYLATDTSAVERNRKNALLKLADDAAERAYQLMMSDF